MASKKSVTQNKALVLLLSALLLLVGFIAGSTITKSNYGDVFAHSSTTLPNPGRTKSSFGFSSACPKVVVGTQTINISSPIEGATLQPDTYITMTAETSRLPVYFFANDTMLGDGQYTEDPYIATGGFRVELHWKLPKKPGAQYVIKAVTYEGSNINEGCVVDSVTVSTAK